MFGPTWRRLSLRRLLGFLETTFSFPSLPRSICLPSPNACLMQSRTVWRAFLERLVLRPVFSAMLAAIVFLGCFMYFGPKLRLRRGSYLGFCFSTGLNLHSIYQEKSFLLRTVMVYFLNVSPVTQ